MLLNEDNFGQPAEYNGEYHDSQTQAAWAAYFTAAEMPYVTEPETFYIKDFNTIYTPDFFLPEQDTYVEVKNGNINWMASFKIAMLARRTGKMGLLINGMPHNMSLFCFGSESTNFPNGNEVFVQRKFADLYYYPKDIFATNVFESKQTYTERIASLAEAAKTGWSTTIPQAIVDAHTTKKADLRQNMRII